MSTPKDHHYVPRAFFQPWADKFKKVIVYERKEGEVLLPYRQSTRSICVKTGLYSYTDSVQEQKRNIIEQNLFKLIDDKANTVLKKLYATDGVADLTEQQKRDFAAFIISLRTRTPEAFQCNAQNAEKILREELQRNDPELKEDGSLLEWAEKNFRIILENYGREVTAGCIIDDKLVSPIMRMQWVVLKRTADATNLLSSDRPLIFQGNMNSGDSGFALAISPDRILIAANKLQSLEKVAALSPKVLIKKMNISTIQQAKNKAFAIDYSHSIEFFRNRLGMRHDILPWATIESS